MSKIDELAGIGEAARQKCAADGGSIAAMSLARIRAVVTALRDEMCARQATPERDPIHMTTEDLWLAFNEILGDAGNEKAAGGPTCEDGRVVEQSDHDIASPAAPTTAPESCEWSPEIAEECYVTACGLGYVTTADILEPRNRYYCPCVGCGKPVKFKESKT